MAAELMIVTVLFGTFIALSAKALYHRNRALKMLDILDEEAMTLRAKIGLTSRYEQAQERQRISQN